MEITTPTPRNLFRAEVSDKDRKRWLGEILLAQPVTFTFMAAFSACVLMSVCVGLYFIEYTRKERVTGQVSLDKGSVKVFPQASGSIIKRHFKEGDSVESGQVLFTLNVEKTSAKLGDTQEEISRQITKRRAYLQAEKTKQLSISQEEELALRLRLKDITAELAKNANELTTQQRRMELSKLAANRSKELNAQNFVSQADLDAKEQDVLEQQSRLQSLERSSLTLQKEINGITSDIQNAPLRAVVKQSEFDRLIASLSQDSAETESKREIVVRAPQAGKAITVLVENGQIASPDKPLVTILPNMATLEATLFVATKAVGFIEPGHKVQLRYDAYPYQKFGQYEGVVREVSRTALSPEDLKLSANKHPENLYRVIVTLTNQTVQAYGKPVPLQDGMQLEADVLLDTRRLYEWVLEPLYSLTGKL